MRNKLQPTCLNHIYNTFSFIVLVLFFQVNGIAGTYPTVSTGQTDQENNSFAGPHYRIYCFENNNPTSENVPKFSSDSLRKYQISYTDQHHEMTEAKGFAGYFDLARWQKNFGDGGVDVTGAPNVALVEGANAALVKMESRQQVMLEIDIPAEGFIKFDWRKIGGSYFSLEIKAAAERFYLEKGLNGHYISPLLQAGDQLLLSFSAPADTLGFSELKLENFHFFTSAGSIITRNWMATDEEGLLASFTQYISVEMPELTKVNFPEPMHISESSAIYHAEFLSPDITGFPFFDADGNPETKNDQMLLENSNCAFEVKWEDELIMEEDNWTLMRHWYITDPVFRNEIQKTQIIKLYTSAVEMPISEQLYPSSQMYIGTVYQQKPAIQFRDWTVPEK